MYLSRLDIVGFKSFAQKTAVVFDSGISAIVGPNGCGKTNIVDAIRWVLGEQRYSALRSDKMEDVIFNGTKARKPLGMAEASLVIENTKGILPSEYTQVTIGRRVYRSGESEYLLNRVPCRLKDIQDLFMDTGMGSDAYSVIELKMIETILSDRTDERRRLFEEAAGVTKYKHRRKAAYRKLESVQADLLRVHDIVVEIHKAVATLERQARRAEQYNELKTRLRTIEVDLLEREYAQYLARLAPLTARLDEMRGAAGEMEAGMAEQEDRLENLRRELADADRTLTDAQRALAVHTDRMHKTEERQLVASERIRALADTLRRFEEQQVTLRAELLRLGASGENLRSRTAALATEKATREAEHGAADAALTSFREEVDRKKEELQRLSETLFAVVHDIAERQSDQDTRRGRLEALRLRREHASAEIASYDAEFTRLDAAIADKSADDHRLRRAFTEAEVRYYDAEKRRNDLKDMAAESERRSLELVTTIDRHRSRIDFLKGLIESGEGLSEGARFLGATGRWGGSRPRMVGDAVHAEGRFLVAVEAALGEAASMLIVGSAADADLGIGLLREKQKGKVTFVALDRLPHIERTMHVPPLPGVHGWAADLAGYDREHAPLFHLLLERTLIVEDAAAARRALDAVAGLRCVTLDGEVFTGAGIARGGSRRQDEGGSIGKQHQIEELEASIAGLTRDRERIDREREAVLRDHDAIDLRSLNESVKAVEKEMSAIEVRIAQLVFEKKRAGDIIARDREEIAAVDLDLTALGAELEAMLPEVEEARQRREATERAIAALTAELAALETEATARSRAVQELGITVVAVAGDIQNAENEAARDAEASARIDAELLDLGQRSDAARTDRDALSASLAGSDDDLAALRTEMAVLEAARERAETESAGLRQGIHDIELHLRDQRRAHDDALRGAHDIELKVADLTAKRDHVVARAREEFDLALEVKSYPADEFVDFAALREEIQTLRGRLKSLGNINFEAFEEYTREKERLEFMTTQRRDLEEAEKTLVATIEEINATAQRQFLDTFALIRTNFIETFKSLFDPGDECDLKLEEEVDPLEAKIEIVAKPRGKRPTSIDLLSGGEKTLTATALLFAIYLVKPSPFCILDEVDAPLDDANVDRFVRILRKFSDNTQFIVVTHNKRTMEAANALYGVTMEEEGISKLVTVRFNRSSPGVSGAAVASA